MSTFGGLILTNRGRNLQSKAQAGIKLEYTRVGVGNGELGSTSILALNALINEVKSLDITKLKALGNGKAVIGTVLSNQNITEGFYFREIGLFATDPDVGEILYCYGNAGDLAEYISPGGGPDIVEKSIDVQTVIGNAQNVSAVIDESLVYATVEYVQNEVVAHDTDAEAHADIREKMSTLSPYAVASGTNTYIVNVPGITALSEGFAIKIKFTNANTGASTLNINSLGAKAIQKGNGSALSSGNIKAGQICHLAYTGSVFQLLGEGGEYGTAIASDVLDGKTIGTDSGIVEGTMSNLGPAAVETINLTEQNQEYTIAKGYHSGLRKIKAVITGLVASAIKYGAIVGGIEGNFTGDANAVAGQMLKDAIAYVKGNKIVGTILSKTAQIYTPGTTNQTIAAGQYLSGNQTIQGSANLVPENIKENVNLFGKIGTLKPAPIFAPSNLVANYASYEDELGGSDYVGENPITTNAVLFTFRHPRKNNIIMNGVGKIIVKSRSQIFYEYFGGTMYTPFEVQLPITITSPDTSSNSDIYIVFNPDRVNITLSSYSNFCHIYIN
jgi:hypothetical protein